MTHPIEVTNRSGYARDDSLVDAAWLQEHVHDPGLRLVEVDVSPAAYDSGHIEGAVLWNVYSDLKDANYDLLDAAAFTRLVRDSGIDADSTVVVYGYAPAMGLWLLRLFGHPDVRILNCSRDAWTAAGGALTTTPTRRPATAYELPAPDRRIRASLADVKTAIDDAATDIVDVRTAAEYAGERFWPSGGSERGGRAGHVPTARHLPLDTLLDDEGAFRSAEELRASFAGLDGSGPVITYCTIGGRASTAWFVLTDLLGRDNVSVYDGSWAEWGRTPTTPVATG